jgi:acetolactate synthase-1/2/3 large subunit
VLTGDGGLMMCLHELHTAVAESIPVTVVVFNNSDYAIISEAAGMEFDLPEQAYSWADTPLSFVTIAEGMGMEAERAETPNEIRDALSTALASDQPTLLEVPTDPTEPQASTWMSE